MSQYLPYTLSNQHILVQLQNGATLFLFWQTQRLVASRYLKVALTRCSCGEVLLHVPVHFHFGLEKKSKLVVGDNQNTFFQIILRQIYGYLEREFGSWEIKAPVVECQMIPLIFYPWWHSISFTIDTRSTSDWHSVSISINTWLTLDKQLVSRWMSVDQLVCINRHLMVCLQKLVSSWSHVK